VLCCAVLCCVCQIVALEGQVLPVLEAVATAGLVLEAQGDRQRTDDYPAKSQVGRDQPAGFAASGHACLTEVAGGG
jgi:hypothetical protein